MAFSVSVLGGRWSTYRRSSFAVHYAFIYSIMLISKSANPLNVKEMRNSPREQTEKRHEMEAGVVTVETQQKAEKKVRKEFVILCAAPRPQWRGVMFRR